MKIGALICLLIVVSWAFANHSSDSRTVGSTRIDGYAAKVDANALYGKKCSGCHGKDGHGLPAWRSLGQPDFGDANWQRSVTDAQLTASIANGKGDYMPAWKGKLSDEEIKAMVAVVRDFGKK